MENARQYLSGFQLDEGEDISPAHPHYGGIGYGGDDRPDLSNLQLYAWLCDHYSVDENPHFGTSSLYYYFMTATKSLKTYGQDTMVDSQGNAHDWRQDFLNKIISLQHEEGHWVNADGRYQENIKDLATAYSVIAMKYALQSY